MKKIKPRKVTEMLQEVDIKQDIIKTEDIPRDKNGMPKLRGIG